VAKKSHFCYNGVMSLNTQKPPDQRVNTVPIDPRLKAEAVQIVTRKKQNGEQSFLRAEIDRLRMWGANQIVAIVGPKRFIDALVALQTMAPGQQTMHALMSVLEPDAGVRLALYDRIEQAIGAEPRYQTANAQSHTFEGGNIPMAAGSALRSLRSIDTSATRLSPIAAMVSKIKARTLEDPAGEWLTRMPHIDPGTAAALIQEMEQNGGDFHTWARNEEGKYFAEDQQIKRDAATCVAELQAELGRMESGSRFKHNSEIGQLDTDIAQVSVQAASSTGKEVFAEALQKLNSRRAGALADLDRKVREDTQGCRNIIDRLAIIANGAPIYYKMGDPLTTEDIMI
jgi:hypothetical protein